MHAKTFWLGLALLLVPAAEGCSSNDNESVKQEGAELSETDAKQKAVSYVPGTAGAVEKIDSATERRWAVTVTTSANAEVVVEIERSGGQLDEIVAEKGPFEYELPLSVAGVLPYAKAKENVLAAKKGTIEAWELNVGKNIWEFYVRESADTLWEVKLDAKSGALNEAEKKAARD